MATNKSSKKIVHRQICFHEASHYETIKRAAKVDFESFNKFMVKAALAAANKVFARAAASAR